MPCEKARKSGVFDNIEKNKLRVKMRNSFTILKINLVFSYRIKKSFK